MAVNCLDGRYDRFPGDVTIAARLDTVRACLEGPFLARCRAVVALPTVQCVRLFPTPSHRNNILRIARRMRLKEHDGSHEGCARCAVVQAVKSASFHTLIRVAKHEDPSDQLAAAAAFALHG